MISVLFVCLGNICRSPMAEAVFRRKVEEAGLSDRIRIDSAGTAGWHEGKPPHEGTRELLDRKGISWKGQQARQVRTGDFREFQWIMAMDAANAGDLRQLQADADGANVKLMLDYYPEAPVRDVPDPYYTGNFEEVFELLDTACDNLLGEIRRQHKL